MSRLVFLAFSAALLSVPMATLAEEPGAAPKAHAPASAGADRRRGAATPPHAPTRPAEPAGAGKARPGQPAAAAATCPPGLAKKTPACVPPGQARRAAVGDMVDRDRVHVISRPGLYGLSVAPDGQDYAVVDGRLVRIDRQTGRILSILRAVEAILD